MKPFYELTNTGRARRLRGLALQALAHYDLDVAHLRLITNMYNAIYRVDTASGERVVMRVMRPGERTDAEVDAQAIWLAELSRAGLGVPRPIPNRDGALITHADAPGVPQARQCMLTSWIPGVNLGRRISPANVARQGALLARMHAVARDYPLPDDFAVKVFDRLYPYPEPFVLENPAALAPLPEADRALVGRLLRHVEMELVGLIASDTPRHLLHGDLHQWNVKLARGAAYAIDFDDMLLGYAVQDIGITLYYYRASAEYEALRAAFQRGYETVLPWPERFPGEVETWIAGRGLTLLNSVVASDDPDDRQHLDWCLAGLRVTGPAALASPPPAS